uniref:vacuolar fusion protein MON1 homolog A isoform X2 n=1 Tax=Myxine glutinosa TaxID=7769 RepID=UPI00358F3644
MADDGGQGRNIPNESHSRVLFVTEPIKNMTRTPPGENMTRTPPGESMTRTPPGENVTHAPPGEDITRTPPGEDITRTPPGEDITRAPPGEDMTRAPPGESKKNVKFFLAGDQVHVDGPEVRSESPAPGMTEGTEPGATCENHLFLSVPTYEDLLSCDEESDNSLQGNQELCEDAGQSLHNWQLGQLSKPLNKLALEQVDEENFEEDEIIHQEEWGEETCDGDKDGVACTPLNSLEELDLGVRMDDQEGLLEDDVHRSPVRRNRASRSSASSRDSQDVMSEAWWSLNKHVFVLSEAGKPIYSRYGSEEALSSFMGVLLALVSFVQAAKNVIRSIHSDNHTVMFLHRGPLVLVSVSRTRQSEQQLAQELHYVYNQIISVLTITQLNKVFKAKQNYDLRRLLGGTERFLNSLLNLMEQDPCFLLTAVRCLPLPSSVRDSVSQSLQQARAKDLVFAVLLAKNQLVCMVRMKDQVLHPTDLHLLLNLVSGSTSFREGEIAMDKDSYSVSQAGVPDLQHFIYKCKSTSQFTSPEMDAPYNCSEQRERLFGLYQQLHSRIHSASRPLKLIYHVWHFETLLAWVTAGFELYTCFSPLVTKAAAIHAITKLLRWIKKEEERLFIMNPLTF